MVILHAFLALLAGYAVMAVIVVAVTALLTRLTPEWCGQGVRPTAAYLFVNLGYSFLAGAAGGYVTAWISAASPLLHPLVLAVIVLLLGAVSAFASRGKQPLAYQLALIALSPVGVLAGALVRLRVLGVL
jgi:hypothetical protein